MRRLSQKICSLENAAHLAKITSASLSHSMRAFVELHHAHPAVLIINHLHQRLDCLWCLVLIKER